HPPSNRGFARVVRAKPTSAVLQKPARLLLPHKRGDSRNVRRLERGIRGVRAGAANQARTLRSRHPGILEQREASGPSGGSGALPNLTGPGGDVRREDDPRRGKPETVAQDAG